MDMAVSAGIVRSKLKESTGAAEFPPPHLLFYAPTRIVSEQAI
jgi:hypothetical protein